MLYSSTAAMKIQQYETVTAWKSKQNMVWQNESFKARQKGSYLLNKLHKHLKEIKKETDETCRSTANRNTLWIAVFSFVF